MGGGCAKFVSVVSVDEDVFIALECGRRGAFARSSIVAWICLPLHSFRVFALSLFSPFFRCFVFLFFLHAFLPASRLSELNLPPPFRIGRRGVTRESYPPVEIIVDGCFTVLYFCVLCLFLLLVLSLSRGCGRLIFSTPQPEIDLCPQI